MSPPPTVKAVLLIGAAAVAHHASHHGSPVDYLTIAALSFASWAGVPGPGESALIASGFLAAKGKLDLAEVIAAAFGGGWIGGVVGWIFGAYAGRRMITAAGPLYGLRVRALEHGEHIFARFPAAAVLLAPSWVCGIHRVPTGRYLVWNTVGDMMWAPGIGLAAYFVGPPVVDALADEGLVAGILLALLVVVGIVVGRRRGHIGHRGPDGPAGGRSPAPHPSPPRPSGGAPADRSP